MTLALSVLVLAVLAIAYSAWRIRAARKALRPPDGDEETIGQLNDRMERDFEELFRKWEKK